MELSGKTAFVTGAANGIGLGICRALARHGVNIVLADIELAQLEIAQRELATFNVRTHAIEVDVSDAAAFERLAAHLAARDTTFAAPTEHVFYLATPPTMIEPIVRQLCQAKLLADKTRTLHAVEEARDVTWADEPRFGGKGRIDKPDQVVVRGNYIHNNQHEGAEGYGVAMGR